MITAQGGISADGGNSADRGRGGPQGMPHLEEQSGYGARAEDKKYHSNRDCEKAQSNSRELDRPARRTRPLQEVESTVVLDTYLAVGREIVSRLCPKRRRAAATRFPHKPVQRSGRSVRSQNEKGNASGQPPPHDNERSAQRPSKPIRAKWGRDEFSVRGERYFLIVRHFELCPMPSRSFVATY